MTTIIDPNGTPEPVYTRSGTTIQTVAASGQTALTGTPIVTVSGHSIVIVNTDEPDQSHPNAAVLLPDDAQVGDLVEIWAEGNGTSGCSIFPPSGETIVGGTPNVSISKLKNGALFRKTSATEWRFLCGSGGA